MNKPHWNRHHLVENHLDAWVYAKTTGPQLGWGLAGNTSGLNGSPWNFGNIAGDRFFTGDFTGPGQAEVMFHAPDPDGTWWLATCTGSQLNWTRAGNTSGKFGGPNFGNIDGNRFFTGDFTGSGKTEVMFHVPPPDGNWWLGTCTGSQLNWTLAGNTSGKNGPNFGNIAPNPFFTGDFTGSGKAELMFCAPAPDGTWWLATFTGSQMSWTGAGNTAGRASPWDFGDTSKGRFFTGKFSGGSSDEIIFSSPGGNWMLGAMTGGQLGWTPAANTAGFGNVVNLPFFIGDFTGSGQAQVMFYYGGDGNWWHAGLQPSVLPPDSFCAAIPGYASLSQSALYFAVAFTGDNPQGDLRRVLPDTTPPHGYSSAEQLARTQALDTDGDLPDWLAQAIVQALVATYADAPHPQILRGGAFQPTMDAALQQAQLPPDPPLGFTVPPGFPLPWQVQTAYKLMLSFFKRAYMDDFDLPLPPAPGAAGPAQWPDFGNLTIDPSSVGSVFTSIIDDIGKAAGDILNSFASFISLLTDPLSLPLRQALYNNLTLPAWQGARSLRHMLVEFGYLTPQSFEVDGAGRLKHPNEIDFRLITLGNSLGQPTLPDPGYPWQRIDGEFQRPWVYPATQLGTGGNPFGPANNSENAATRAGAFAAGALPDKLLRHDQAASNALRLSYETAGSPADTDAISASPAFGAVSARGVSPLGDCVEFAAYLIGRLAAPGPPPADFNLDADRGYGYLCWDWDRDTREWPGQRGQLFNPPTGWTQPPDPLHFPQPSQPLQLHYLKSRALTSWVDSSYQHIGHISRDGHVHHLSFALGQGPWTDIDLTTSTGEPAAASSSLTSWVDKTFQHLVFAAADGHVHEYYYLPGATSWGHGDLTANTGAPPAAGTLTSWVDATYQHVVYVSADGHVHELYFTLGTGPWRHGDLTAAAGAPPAAPVALTSWVDASYQHLAYISAADGHVHEFYFALGTGPWHDNDLTAGTGAPAAAPGALTSWADATYQHLVYLSAGGGHVYELKYKLGSGPWAATDLTAGTGAPAAGPGALTSWVDKTYQHVAYVSADGHVQELYHLPGSPSWGHGDLTVSVAPAAPPAAGAAGALTSWTDPTYQHVVYFSGDRHIQELYYPLGAGPWRVGDLTAAAGGHT